MSLPHFRNRIFVFGSCVSRDVLNFGNDRCQLVDYFARSSLASAFHERATEDPYSERLASAFQRRIVAADFSKQLAGRLTAADFDTLLVDFIDERFDLFCFDDGAVCTLSGELLSTGFLKGNPVGRVVKSGSDEFFALWVTGWDRFWTRLGSLGLRDRVRLNRVFWATETVDGGDFSPAYRKERIDAANGLLARLYAHVTAHLSPHQFLKFPASAFRGGVTHRWGTSPFHYADEYYRLALGQLSSGPTNSSVEEKDVRELSNYSTRQRPLHDLEDMSERLIISSCCFKVISTNNMIARSIFDCALSGNCIIENRVNSIYAQFDGIGNTHQIFFRLPTPVRSNGLSIRIRINNWNSFRYLAFGYTHQNAFRHVKVVNPAQGEWINLTFGHGDIGFGLQNNWEHPPPVDVSDVRVYLRAEPGAGGAGVEVEHFICWEEESVAETSPSTCTRPLVLPERKPVLPALLDVLYGYFRKCFRNVQTQAHAYMTEGQCPLYGGVQLPWCANEALPSGLSTVGTYAFSWHSLHPASILLTYARNTGQDAPIYAAREIVTNWLDRSYYTPDIDKKFAWYDHGTAERLLTFILMWAEGTERDFDARFMTRLGEAIVRHAQLLESELFYASHQPTRYHNHAWFQDLALLVTALALPGFPSSNRWLERALVRLTDQLATLIVRDSGFAVFVENSIGYHQGVQRITELAGNLVSLSGRDSRIPEIAIELSNFSEFFRYPDNRSPAQGDTFRLSNRNASDMRRGKAYLEPLCAILPQAGYGVVKGNHDDIPYMFTMFATSLCRTHKHEDNLSFTLFFDGIEWLIDPSFYSHEYAAPVPAYLRSAVAHNALAIPGLNYSIDPGVVQFGGEVFGQVFSLHGEHRAYKGVVIQREVRGDTGRLALDFLDSATGLSDTDSEGVGLYWMLHCGEHVEATLNGRALCLTHPDSRYQLLVQLPSDAAAIYRGCDDGPKIRGITGRGFMESGPVCTIECAVPFNQQIPWHIVAQAV